MLKHAHNIIKYMPVDKNTSDLITPIFDFTSKTNNIAINMVDIYETTNKKNVEFR